MLVKRRCSMPLPLRLSQVASEIYRLDRNAVQKTTLTLPGSLLAEGQSYTVSLVYHGQTYGDSAAATLDFSCAETFKGIKAPTLSLQGANDDGLVDYAASYVASQFEYIGGEDTCDKVDWELYKGDDEVWSAANSTILRYLGSFGDYTLEPSTAYVLKYRQHAKTNDVWSAWAELAFTTVSEFTMPTFKIAIDSNEWENPGHDTINLKKVFGWWDSVFTVYIDGELDASITSNPDQDIEPRPLDYDDSSQGEVTIEVKRVDGKNKFPYFSIAGLENNKSLIGDDSSFKATLRVLAPLPTLYVNKDDEEPCKCFGTNIDKAYRHQGLFSNCSHLESLPDDLFKYNPQITDLGGVGAGGGGGGVAGGHGRGSGIGGFNNGVGGDGEMNAGAGGGGSLGEIYDGDSGPQGADYEGNGLPGGHGYGCFSFCQALRNLPENLFAYCPNIVNLGGSGGGGGGGAGAEDGGAGGHGYGCFSGCYSLETLPENLFAYCPNIVNLGGVSGGDGGPGDGGNPGGYGGNGYGCFYMCGLKSLPENLFAHCPNIINVGGLGNSDEDDITRSHGFGCFSDCYSLETLPENLFAHCPNICNCIDINCTGGGGKNGSAHQGGGGNGLVGGGGQLGGVHGPRGGGVSMTFTPVDAFNLNIATSSHGVFYNCSSLKTVPEGIIQNFNTGSEHVGQIVGTFEGCSALSAVVKLDHEDFESFFINNFAKGNKAKATVFAKSGSTTYNSFHENSSANANVVPF